MTKKRAKIKTKELAPVNPKEKIRHEELLKHEKTALKIETNEDGVFNFKTPKGATSLEKDLWMTDSLGVNSVASVVKLTLQLARLDSDEKSRVSSTNQRLSMVADLKPQDNIEAMLATQMVTIQDMMMDCAARAMIHDQSFEGRKFNLNSAIKLSRAYVTLVDSLNKHRGKGQQKMTVEHVHVNDGGQAIIGSVDKPTKSEHQGA